MHARKTGALIRAATVAGAIMAGAPPARVDAVDRYAAWLGLAFQIVDDILDVEGDVRTSARPPGKDAAAGKPTYPSLFGLERVEAHGAGGRRRGGRGPGRGRARPAAASPRSPSGWSRAPRSAAAPCPPHRAPVWTCSSSNEGLAASRERARALILAGRVKVGGEVVSKAGASVPDGAAVAVVEPDFPWVGRGGVKLAHALDTFGIDVAGREALDIGASTGGFTDVLLQRGARRVVALDVGHGQLDWRLREDPRVVVHRAPQRAAARTRLAARAG